jgi:hypothetical protein
MHVLHQPFTGTLRVNDTAVECEDQWVAIVRRPFFAFRFDLVDRYGEPLARGFWDRRDAGLFVVCDPAGEPIMSWRALPWRIMRGWVEVPAGEPVYCRIYGRNYAELRAADGTDVGRIDVDTFFVPGQAMIALTKPVFSLLQAAGLTEFVRARLSKMSRPGTGGGG